MKSHNGGAKPVASFTSPQAASSKLSSDKIKAFQSVIEKSTHPPLVITAKNYRAGHISAQQTTQPAASGSLFYHEVQHRNSGSCGIHAANAYLGEPAIDAASVAKECNEIFGADVLSADEIAKGGADGLPLANAMGAAHAHKTGDANELKEILGKHQSAIDRVMIGISGNDEDAHWVAFRKDAGGAWHFINSYPGQNKGSWNKLLANDPQPQLSPVTFMESFAKNAYSNYQVIMPKVD
ncbi:hypothetical protein BFF94_026040 [Burkholderia catarinensis]|nr:hypothetical protein BFF94_026040 [Burkholderia catarinensis]